MAFFKLYFKVHRSKTNIWVFQRRCLSRLGSRNWILSKNLHLISTWDLNISHIEIDTHASNAIGWRLRTRNGCQMDLVWSFGRVFLVEFCVRWNSLHGQSCGGIGLQREGHSRKRLYVITTILPFQLVEWSGVMGLGKCLDSVLWIVAYFNQLSMLFWARR